MKIRKNVVLLRWQDEYVRSVAKKMGVSFSEAVRIIISCCSACKIRHMDEDVEKIHFKGMVAWEKKATG